MADILKVRINGGWESIPAIQGKGVNQGGTTGQVLTKKSNADYDTEWKTPPQAPVTSVNEQTGDVVIDYEDVGALPVGYHDPTKADLNDFNAHTSNSNNPHGVNKTQVGLGSVVNAPMDSVPTENSTHYITSGGVKSYVDAHGGKIDSITVNGESQALPISNKNVTIPKVTQNNTTIPLMNNAFNVTVPTKTSDLTNDGDGTSNFATLQNVSTSVGAEALLRANGDSALGDRIDQEANARSQADSDLQDNIDAEEQARISGDNLRILYTDIVNNAASTATDKPLSANIGKSLQGLITQESLDRISGDNLRVLYTDIINNTTSTATDKPLSANMGKSLQDELDAEEEARLSGDNQRVLYSDIINNTTSTETQKPLSANMGKSLLDQIDAEESARGDADDQLLNNIDAEEEARIAADNLRVLTSNIINTTSSTDTDKPLSAKMGKELLDQINNLKAIGRFLSLWDCATGLPATDPTVSPYTYKTGDYFIVNAVSSATPAVNYKPNGPTYTIGTASTTKETGSVLVNDYYVYDGSLWRLVTNTQRTVTFENIAGDPYDNTNLSAALGNKENTSNKTQTVDLSSTSDQYPSAAATYTAITSHVPADMTGATSAANGTHGLVPQPNAGDQAKFLRGDATWATVDLPNDMTGATASSAGTHGLVPAPAAGDQNKYLQGNGAWTTIDALPSQSGQSGKFLTTNGTVASWATVVMSNTAFGTIITNTTSAQYTFTHNLNSQNVMVLVVNSNYETIQIDVTRTNANTVTIEFGTVPTSAETYHVYCVASTATTIPSGEEVGY